MLIFRVSFILLFAHWVILQFEVYIYSSLFQSSESFPHQPSPSHPFPDDIHSQDQQQAFSKYTYSSTSSSGRDHPKSQTQSSSQSSIQGCSSNCISITIRISFLFWVFLLGNFCGGLRSIFLSLEGSLGWGRVFLLWFWIFGRGFIRLLRTIGLGSRFRIRSVSFIISLSFELALPSPFSTQAKAYQECSNASSSDHQASHNFSHPFSQISSHSDSYMHLAASSAHKLLSVFPDLHQDSHNSTVPASVEAEAEGTGYREDGNLDSLGMRACWEAFSSGIGNRGMGSFGMPVLGNDCSNYFGLFLGSVLDAVAVLAVLEIYWDFLAGNYCTVVDYSASFQQSPTSYQFIIIIRQKEIISHSHSNSFIFTYIIMNLKQPLSEIFHLDADSFIVCTGTNYKTVIKQNSKLRYADSLEILCKIINTLGQLSAASQGLKQVITNITRFSGSDQRIYIKVQDSQALGFVKVGQKTLFYRNLAGTIKQLDPTCVLDIYVHESCQRSGFGKEIFQKFLKEENVVPEQLAYDRPSPKLIAFLKKYYQLSQFVPQNNNFVIFNRFFTGNVNGNGNGTVSKYFFNRNRTASIQKQNRDSASKTSFKIADNTNTKSIISQQPSKQQKIIDSLQLLKQQVQKSKTRTTLELPYPQSQKPSYHNNPSSRPPQSNARYSLNMKLKDLSYRIPWATENGEGKGNFRTTSGMYGEVYRK